MRRIVFGILASGAALLAGSANADTFSYSTDFGAGVGAEWSISAPQYVQDPGILGEMSNGGPASATLNQNSTGPSSAALNGSLSFDLLGFRTIDGVNCCTDVFNLIINGSTRYQAAFDMGGGGSEVVFFNPDGATYTSPNGQDRRITIPFTAVLGTNTFEFLYPNLQGFNDEAFGLDNVSFSAEVTPAGPGVPEPASWALMILGFGGAGAALRSRRRAQAATA